MGLKADAASGQDSDNAGKAKGGLDDAITAAFDASEADDISSLEIEESPKSEPKVKAKAKAKVKTEDEPDENAGDDAPSEDAEAPEASEESAEGQPLSAPKHWPADDKNAFAKMTREGQEIALKLAKNLEGGFTRKSQELSDKARYADTVRGLIGDQRRANLQSQGIDEMAYLRRLNDIYAMAERDPVNYIKWAMQSMGVTPDKLGISQAAPQTPPNGQTNPDDDIARLLADPEVAQLKAELHSLKGIIDKEQQAKEQASRTQHANAVNQLNTTIRSFREALDEHGQLQYPHFDAVMAHMGALMDTDPDLNQIADGPDKLKAAYDMAVWARPDLRQSFIKAEAQKEIQEAQKKKDAERAKRITSVKPAAGVVSTKPKTNSLDDALSQALSKHGL
jgi:hypothetical protein